jgi:hypothetical protein
MIRILMERWEGSDEQRAYCCDKTSSRPCTHVFQSHRCVYVCLRCCLVQWSVMAITDDVKPSTNVTTEMRIFCIVFLWPLEEYSKLCLSRGARGLQTDCTVAGSDRDDVDVDAYST